MWFHSRSHLLGWRSSGVAMTSWLQAVSRGLASLSPAHRRRRRQEADRAERLRRQDQALQELLARPRYLAQLKGVGDAVLEKLGGDVTLEDVVGLDAALSAARAAPTLEKRTEILVGAIARHGLRFATYVDLSAQLDPSYGPLSEAVRELRAVWARGKRATDRADEQDARARYMLDALETVPAMARTTAGAVLALPPGHPLRDEHRVRRGLDEMLREAVDGAVGADGAELELRTEYALLAMSGLIEHELVDRERIDSLLAAGLSLLASPHIGRGGETFRWSVGAYLVMRAEQARKKGETVPANRDAAQATSLLEPLSPTEDDPVRAEVFSLLVRNAAGNGDEVPLAMDAVSAIVPGDRVEERAAIIAAHGAARRAAAEGNPARAVEILSPLLAMAENRFLSAVLDVDVAEAGETMADVATTLAFAHAHLGAFGKAAAVLDRAKSIRFRYQAMVRSGPLGWFVAKLEADIHAASRGLSPAGGEELAQLLETYRQTREKVPADGLRRPGVAEVASVLDGDEAVAVVGMAAQGLLLLVIRQGDREEPSHGEVCPPGDSGRMVEALVDGAAGWMVALGAVASVEPRRSIVQLLRTADEVLGARIATALRGACVRRLTVVPHNMLHVIPWWALPSLASFEVMAASSAGQLVTDRRPAETAPARALVVSDPTCDLPLASMEGAVVAAHLSRTGFSVDALSGVEATEEAVAQQADRSGIVHFAGHSRSEMVEPAHSALEVHPVVDGDAGAERDDLLDLARSVEWQPVRKLAGTDWVDVPNEDRADVPGRGRLERRFRFVHKRVELRLEHGPAGSLLGQYVLEPQADADGRPYGRRLRLSELWTAGDLLVGSRFRHCALVFLSSCESGLGRFGTFDESAGLPAALQLAGAAAVVSSLWPVEEETAAVFADLFYQALAGARTAGGPVDVLTLVHLTRHRLRTLTRDDAAAILRRLRERATDPLTRFRLEGRIAGLDDAPFSHPSEWAAFQVTGAPVPPLPRPVGHDAAAMTPAIAPSTGFDLPPADLEPDRARLARGSDDVFAVGSDAEIVLAATDDPALRKLLGEWLYERGAAHLRAGNRAEAERDLHRVLEADPDNVAARLTLSRTRLAAGDRGAAVQHADAVLAAEPDNAGALLIRGVARTGLGDVPGARGDLDAALAASPDEATAVSAYRARAQVRFAAGEPADAAVADLTEAIALRPEDPEPYFDRARKRIAAGDHDGALADADRARFFLADAATCLDVRGLALLSAGRADEAVAAVERALELDPEGVDYHLHLALALDAAGQDERAVTEYARALEADATADVHENRGLVHARNGRHDAALADYEAALHLDPQHVSARYNRACAYSRKAKPGTVVDDLRAAVAAEPTLRDHARTDPDLEWARVHLPEVTRLLDPLA